MKIYNEIVIDMNPESSSYGKTLHEDSFEYAGDMMLLNHETDEYGNTLSHCPAGQTEQPDGTCADAPNIDIVDVNRKDRGVGCESDTECPYPQTCVDGACTQDDITCWDGSIRGSLAECPDPEYDFQTPSEWIEGEDWTKPEWYEDLTTGNLEWEDYLFETVAGGEEGTGYEKQEWLDLFKDQFLEFEQSPQFQEYANILEQMGLKEKGKESLYDAWRADKEASILETKAVSKKYGAEYEGLTYAAESQFIGAGGGVSGRNIAKLKRAAKGLSIGQSLELEGIQMDIEGHQDTYDRELQNVESAQLQLENTLLNLEQDYADKLESLFDPVTMVLTCENNTDCGDGQLCMKGECVPDPAWGTTISTEGADISDIDLSGLTREEALDTIAEEKYGWRPGAGVEGQEFDIPWDQIGEEYDRWLSGPEEGEWASVKKSCPVGVNPASCNATGYTLYQFTNGTWSHYGDGPSKGTVYDSTDDFELGRGHYGMELDCMTRCTDEVLATGEGDVSTCMEECA